MPHFIEAHVPSIIEWLEKQGYTVTEGKPIGYSIIKTEQDYQRALADIDQYFDREPEPGSPEGDRFEMLALLIEDYERRVVGPIGNPKPVDAIKCSLEFRGLGQTDLADILGSDTEASDLLSGSQPISLRQALLIRKAWGLSLDVLIPRDRRLIRAVGLPISMPKCSPPKEKIDMTKREPPPMREEIQSWFGLKGYYVYSDGRRVPYACNGRAKQNAWLFWVPTATIFGMIVLLAWYLA